MSDIGHDDDVVHEPAPYGPRSNDPHARALLDWIKERFDSGLPVETDEIVERDRLTGCHVFEWNNDQAGPEYRKVQARHLMQRFNYWYQRNVRVRGWVSLRTPVGTDQPTTSETPTSERAYWPITTVVRTPSFREQLIAKVTRKIETQLATLRFLNLTPAEHAHILAKVEAAMARE